MMNKISRMYKKKSVAGYYDTPRVDVVKLIPRHVENVLEVGCGAGATLAYLKNRGLAQYVVGVDINEKELKEATRMGVDKVVCARLGEDGIFLGRELFDCILCLDVLEHLVDPWKVLDELVPLLRPGGTVIASIPNVQNIRVVLPLIAGRWTYRECGILDETHLRFFTKRSSIALLEGAGLVVDRVAANLETHPIPRFLNVFTLGVLRRFVTVQYLIRARKA